jgi:hypothetical protein
MTWELLPSASGNSSQVLFTLSDLNLLILMWIFFLYIFIHVYILYIPECSDWVLDDVPHK